MVSLTKRVNAEEKLSTHVRKISKALSTEHCFHPVTVRGEAEALIQDDGTACPLLGPLLIGSNQECCDPI